jgi:DNA (cytosine-5)-methyltransferase 1
MHKFPYKWHLKDGYPKKNGYKVFSCFACGGGSTMGYKLAGFEVIGANEIDPKMAECYKVNHNPKHLFVEPIQEFKNRQDLPEELFNLDILDGSPPCSSFSMAGNREKDWGKEKKFREGQADQILDTLFFDYIDLAKRLQPKIVIAENVKGLLMGAAKEYVWRIYQAFDKAGYYVHKWLLDASKMGVPQRRERVFFVAIRKDLTSKFEGAQKIDLFNPMPYLDMGFNEPLIPFTNYDDGIVDEYIYNLVPRDKKEYENVKKGEQFSKYTGSGFTVYKIDPQKVLGTLSCEDKSRGGALHYEQQRSLTKSELFKTGAFPLDYKVKNGLMAYKLIGMSVPPVMTAQIASRIQTQWLDKINNI